MNFMGKIVRSLLTAEPSPDTVTSVKICAYTTVPIVARDEGLILFGPTRDGNFELVLQQPIETNRNIAFSLCRLTNKEAAQERFIRLREMLGPLLIAAATTQHFDPYNERSLQTLLTVHRDHPTWLAAHMAVSLGLPLLLQHPAISQYCNTAELERQQTPLHLAVTAQDMTLVRTLLLLQVSLDAVDVAGNSVYHLAAVTTAPLIELVVGSEASMLLNAPNQAGKTPLHLACESDKPACVTALLSAGADVNVAATHDSCLAIHSATAANSPTCAREILRRHPNMLHVQDMKHGGTPLHWSNSRKMIKALFDLNCRVDAKNFEGKTALHLMVGHDRLDCVVALLSYGARPDLTDHDGNTPMHGAKSLFVLQALLVFDAPLNRENTKGDTPRHIISGRPATPERAALLHALHALGAARCSGHLSECGSGCSAVGVYEGAPPATATAEVRQRVRAPYDCFLDEAFATFCDNSGSGGGARMLCLDGGGIRGLVLIVLVRAVHKEAGNVPVNKLFDWIAGTSTGAILAMALAAGRSPTYTLQLYMKLKDLVFVGSRPYNEAPLEEILKNEFGEKTVMADIKGVKVVVTGVLADRFPADLHLFRNYPSGRELLAEAGHPAGDEATAFWSSTSASPTTTTTVTSPTVAPQRSFLSSMRSTSDGRINLLSPTGSGGGQPFPTTTSGRLVPTQPPERQLVWEAVRASGAAPSYFRAYGRFIDGGLIANNPSLDLLTEAAELRAALAAVGRGEEAAAAAARPAVLLSLGTGKPPLEQVTAIDFFRPESFYGSIQMAFGLSNMAKLLIDQATMAENHTVDRCRAWCATAGVRYVRLSPQLSADIALDETRDEVLLQMLFEAQVYCYNEREKIQKLANYLIQGRNCH